MKNILLFFLSDIHLTDKGEFQETPYENDKFKCIQTNESAIDYLIDLLAQKKETLDAAFYFSSNKTKAKLAVSVDGKNVEKTHAEWFINRVTEKHPVLPSNFFNPVDYDETKETEESIRQVIRMTDKIKQYLQESAEEVCLHADMTGGFRHASMMMLSVMQFLQYSGVKIGKVLYSNRQQQKIEDVTEIHRMFTLISGADEFINFGSVTEIEKYFKDRATGEKTKKLLDTMREFSDAVKICRTGQMVDIVDQLRSSIQDFSDEKEKGLPEKIFEQIISVLQAEYKEVLENSDGSDKARIKARINIIRWCIHKGFLQQAMTLCTEWLPEILVDWHICYTDSDWVKDAAERRVRYRNWKQNLIIDCNYLEDKKKSKAKQFKTALRHLLDGKPLEKSIQDFPEMEHYWRVLKEEMNKDKGVFGKLKAGKLSDADFSIRFPLIYQISKEIWQKNRKNSTYTITFQTFLERLDTFQALSKQADCLPNESINSWIDKEATLKIETEKTTAELQNPDESCKDKQQGWTEKERLYRKHFASNVIKTDFPEHVMDLLRGYYEIREERNSTNHAKSEGSAEDNKYIENMMYGYLDRLEKISSLQHEVQ